MRVVHMCCTTLVALKVCNSFQSAAPRGLLLLCNFNSSLPCGGEAKQNHGLPAEFGSGAREWPAQPSLSERLVKLCHLACLRMCAGGTLHGKPSPMPC